MDTDQIRQKFNKVLEVVGEDMETVRVGGAKPSLVENLSVEAYGTRMKLMEVASISAPDLSQLVIQPWDKGLIHAIEKGFAESDLHLTPNVNGDIIRIIFPPMTEEKRLDLAKLIHQKLESGKMLLRQARQDLKEDIEHQKGQAGVSEDDIEAELTELEKETEEFNHKLEEMARLKEAEVMKI
jgi:ribosome recycling factor